VRGAEFGTADSPFDHPKQIDARYPSVAETPLLRYRPPERRVGSFLQAGHHDVGIQILLDLLFVNRQLNECGLELEVRPPAALRRKASSRFDYCLSRLRTRMTGAMFWQVESVCLRIQVPAGSLDADASCPCAFC
jgi:hypothetical protein